jgi:hypothetical protein
MTTLIVINLLLGFFDNKLFFDADYIKYLKYKNSIIETKYTFPGMKYEFFKRLPKDEQKIKNHSFLVNESKRIYPYDYPILRNSVYPIGTSIHDELPMNIKAYKKR